MSAVSEERNSDLDRDIIEDENVQEGSHRRFGTSPVYRYFYVVGVDDLEAQCILCKESVTRGTKKSKTTSSMWSHLKAKHNAQYVLIKPKDTEDKQKTKGLTQPTLFQVLEKKTKWDINDEKSKRLHYRIGEMIAVDNQPFSVVEDVGFRRLMEAAQPQYQVPGRTYFSTKIVCDIYDRCRTCIADKLSTASHISFTTDIWSSPYAIESFISFTAHFLTLKFDEAHCVLNVKNFPVSHTAVNIGAILEEMLEMWNIPKDKVHVILRDNAKNMVAGVPEAGIEDAPCFIHTLQLVIKDGEGSQRALIDTLAICRTIVGHFNRSSDANTKLKEIQRKVSDPQHRLIQDVTTRWNSTYYMLDRIVEQKNSLVLFSSDHGLVGLSTNQWKLVSNFLTLLQPFEEITKTVSSTASVISEVVPYVETLKNILSEPNPNHFGLGTMKSTSRKVLALDLSSFTEKLLFGYIP